MVKGEAEYGAVAGARDARYFRRFECAGDADRIAELAAATAARDDAGQHNDAYGYCYWDEYVRLLESDATQNQGDMKR